MAEPRRVPRATYRLQLRPGFGFDEAAAVADYLADLGVSHTYTSPYLQAAPGSTHGYDVVDHSRVNRELGGPAGHERFRRALARAGLGQVIDLVPNHMAIGTPENTWWWDVLANGPSSRYAGYFDVDWDPPESKLRDRVLMPILGDHYGRVLERGEIELTWVDDARFVLRYFEHELPVAPRSVDDLLTRAAARCGSDHLAFIAHSLSRLPRATVTDPVLQEIRHRDTRVLRVQLARLAREDPGVRRAVEEEVAALNADVDALDGLLDRQNYRLAFWRTAGRELDYRRFFDINTLVGLRVESAEVFADTHALALRWLAEGVVDGLRIDHPDGLRDPRAYFELLRAGAPDAWIVVEKILEGDERLPSSWPVDGTTGYDFCARITRLLHDPRGEAPLDDLWVDLVGDGASYAEVVHEAKQRILRDVLAADLNRLTNLFVAIGEEHRRWRDFTRHDLQEALAATAAAFPVYRTYVDVAHGPSAHDRAVIDHAVAVARERRDDLDPEVFDFLRFVLVDGPVDAPGPVAELRMRFQQLTGPVMAKGAEDTAFYDFVRLVSLNEVGSDPSVFSLDVDGFHRAMADAAVDRPASMLTLSTHDTKRSEDVRARLALLSELPGAWSEAVRRWFERNAVHRPVDVPGWPDPRMEYLLYQTLVGAHPLGADRAVAYLEKASKEAKRNTSWVTPVPEYDDALRRFVHDVVTDEAFAADLDGFVQPLVDPGWVNSLAQKLVELTAPGVPDVYQGTELWDLSLVDPDNRRPVDFERRRALLAEVGALSPEERWARRHEGLPKLWVTCRALRLRAERPDWFGAGAGYQPLPTSGDRAGHVVAYARGGAAVVAPRLPIGLAAAGGWDDSTVVALPAGTWYDEMTGREHDGGAVVVGELLARFPVALLRADGPATDPSGTTGA